MVEPLLVVDDLHVSFDTRDGVVRAVDGVSFDVRPGETVALVGESGSGKSVTAQAVLGILDSPPARIAGGSVRLAGRELIGLSEKQYRGIRGEQIAMIFQDSLSALNPVLSVGSQIAEMFRFHRKLGRGAAKSATIEVMERVQIPDPAARYGDYPHQFSGGMRQRVMIAMMIALRPRVLIADEPTTALDVTVQAQIMELLQQIQQENDTAIVLITHDLGVVADAAGRVTVMYAGRVMEHGQVDQIFAHPANPYTAALLASVPRIDERTERIAAIGGLPPNLLHLPAGCAFHPRCPVAQGRCHTDPVPPLIELEGRRVTAPAVGSEVSSAGGPDADDQVSRCWFAQEVVADGIK